MDRIPEGGRILTQRHGGTEGRGELRNTRLSARGGKYTKGAGNGAKTFLTGFRTKDFTTESTERGRRGEVNYE